MKLTPGQVASETWKEVRAELISQRQELLEKLANPLFQESETALIRGQILQISTVLEFEPRPPE